MRQQHGGGGGGGQLDVDSAVSPPLHTVHHFVALRRFAVPSAAAEPEQNR